MLFSWFEHFSVVKGWYCGRKLESFPKINWYRNVPCSAIDFWYFILEEIPPRSRYYLPDPNRPIFIHRAAPLFAPVPTRTFWHSRFRQFGRVVRCPRLSARCFLRLARMFRQQHDANHRTRVTLWRLDYHRTVMYKAILTSRACSDWSGLIGTWRVIAVPGVHVKGTAGSVVPVSIMFSTLKNNIEKQVVM